MGECFSGSHLIFPVFQELSRSYRVGPEALGSQCGNYLRAGKKVMKVVRVVVAVGMWVKNEIIVRFC